ncbi:protein FORGETTER 1-like isoform X4 [Trifolium pratense]|uniref:protein FORGETTER 1-like isoform X4 n=1 Tax=Trifolium pratense TaxID=57577 RepID=UPI001E691357|nr:protein FORGETTER 1-like isoform X4 [Trifolium pratense]XP_045808104.1 protein FORGETTER 1-like isoform X4 [Trifolium pratense]
MYLCPKLLAATYFHMLLYRIFKTEDNFPLVQNVYVDQMNGASTVLYTFILDRGVSSELQNTMLNEKQKAGFGSYGDGFYKSKREWLGKRHVILLFQSSAPAMYKIVRPTTRESPRGPDDRFAPDLF